MAHVNINKKALDNINSENLSSVLNDMIDKELSKSAENIDTVFVDECVNALLELERENNSAAAIVPLISSDKFLKKITNQKSAKGFKSLNTFARVAVVAAIIAGGTMTANAAVEAVTGVNVIQMVADSVESKLIDWGIMKTSIENVDAGFDDDDATTEPVTEPTTEPTTKPTTEPTTRPSTTQPSGIENVDGGMDDDEETTTQFSGIENVDGGMDDDDEETTTQFGGIENVDGGMDDDDEPTTEPNKPSKPSTTQQTTAKPAIEQTTKPEESAVFTQLRVEYDDSFKFDYIYGEKLSYDGMKLIASYSDGSEKEIDLADCKYTTAIDTTVTADYELTILYKSSSIKINVTVRPDEFTRGSEICSNSLFEYLLTEQGAYVTAYKGYSNYLELDEIDGNKVVAIGPSCFRGKGIQSITAQNVTRVYGNAFENCQRLTECYIPSAEYIGDYAFSGCEFIDRAVYSDKLEYIGKGSYNKTAITEIVIPSGVTEIPDYAFNQCESLVSVTMLGKVTSIGSFAFNECVKLETVTGCADITSIGAFAFADDELVNFDTFPQKLERVGESALYFCQNLEIGALPSAIKELAPNAFAYCLGLTEIEIPEGITVIPENCFRATNAEKIILPEGVTEIGKYAFMSHKATSIVLPKSLKIIKTYGLYSVMLRTVYFDRNVEEIGSNAFYAGRSVVFYVYEDTVPMDYAIEYDIKYILRDESAEIGE